MVSIIDAANDLSKMGLIEVNSGILNKTINAIDKKLRTSHFYALALILILVCDFYLMYKSIGPYPPRNYITIFISGFIIIDLFVLNKAQFLARYQFSLMVLGVNLIYIGLSKFYFEGASAEAYIKDLLRFGSLFLALQFLLPRLDRKTIVYSFFFTVLFSVIIALLQIISPDLGWSIREFLDAETCKRFCRGNNRPAGLAYYTLTLAEQLIGLIPIFLFQFKSYFSGKKIIWLGSNLVLLIILVLLENRGATLGYFIAWFIWIFSQENMNKISKILLSLSILACLTTLYNLRDEIRAVNFVEGSDTARLDVFTATTIIARDNFLLGLGPNYKYIQRKFTALKKSHKDYFINPSRLGKISPHNYFLNVHLAYGLLGTIVNLYFIFWFLKRKKEYLCIITIVSFNSFFHNSGILTSTPTAIIFLIYWSLSLTTPTIKTDHDQVDC